MKTRRAAIGLVVAALLAACSSTSEPTLGTVDGEVQDNVGNAVSGITFRLTREGRTPKISTSGTDGKFTFLRVEPGDWKLEFTVPFDYALATAQVNPVDVAVRGSRTTDVQVNLNKKSTGGGGGPVGPSSR